MDHVPRSRRDLVRPPLPRPAVGVIRPPARHNHVHPHPLLRRRMELIPETLLAHGTRPIDTTKGVRHRDESRTSSSAYTLTHHSPQSYTRSHSISISTTTTTTKRHPHASLAISIITETKTTTTTTTTVVRVRWLGTELVHDLTRAYPVLSRHVPAAM